MYTFNLSKATNKAARLKAKKDKLSQEGVEPAKPESNVRVTSPRKLGTQNGDQMIPNLSNQAD